MGREATRAAGNPWYEARKKAAEYDDRLCSREGAAERLGMSVSAVADAELGLSKCMPVDKAVLMADLYKAPNLLNHYCLHECPIGCRHSISDEVLSIDRVTVQTQFRRTGHLEKAYHSTRNPNERILSNLRRFQRISGLHNNRIA